MSAVLVLNATYEPIGTAPWTRAMTWLVAGRAELVTQDSDRVVTTCGGAQYPFPAVVRFVRMVAARRQQIVPYSRHALRVRDGHQCQVAGCAKRGTTVDHVIPRCRGGETSWTNCVLMCRAHNAAKGDRTLDSLGWKLKAAPRAPLASVMLAARADAHPEWTPWLAA